jgi:hypothetical protein
VSEGHWLSRFKIFPSMMTVVIIWRCKCGARLKAIGETDPNQPSGVSVAKCPECQETQVINCHRINSVTIEESGCRLPNSAAIALRAIGAEAKPALPALREALSDPNDNVRRFAALAIDKIEGH